MQLLTEKEKRALGALSKLGEVPVSTIAEEMLVNRTTLYHTIEGLQQKGLVTRVEKDKVSYYRSVSLDEYRVWAKRQVAAIERETTDVYDWLATQREDQPTLHSDTRYFEGVEGVKNLYADTWRDNDEKTIYAVTDYERAYESVLGDFFKKEYFPNRIAHGVSVKSLLPPSEAGERDVQSSEEMLREMRFIDLFKDLGIEINIYGSKIALVVFDDKKPLGVIMKNEIMAKAFRNIFEYLWESVGKR